MGNGKLIADTIQHSTAGNVSTEYVVDGSSKCFVQYKQTSTEEVRQSLNVSSVTDDATGIWTVAFTSNFSNQYYCNSGSSDGGTTTQAVVTNAYSATYDSGNYRSSSTNRCGTRNINDNSLNDRAFNTMTYWGDLA